MSTAGNWLPYLSRFPAPDAEFALRGYAIGGLPPAVTGKLGAAILSAAATPITNDIADGVEAPRLRPGKLKRINKQHNFRSFTARQAYALRAVFDVLREPVARLLRTPWRVLTCRSWTTPPGASIGMNDWHRDGGLLQIPKIMIYSSKTGEGHGGLELRSDGGGVTEISGPPGLWILFYSSVIEHRGVAPCIRGTERVATEITIAPAQAFDLEPRFLGHNARYPTHP